MSVCIYMYYISVLMAAPTRREPYLLPPGNRKFTHGSRKMLYAYIIITYLLTCMYVCMYECDHYEPYLYSPFIHRCCVNMLHLLNEPIIKSVSQRNSLPLLFIFSSINIIYFNVMYRRSIFYSWCLMVYVYNIVIAKSKRRLSGSAFILTDFMYIYYICIFFLIANV